MKGQNALALAQAVRSTSHAHQIYLRTQIAEGEAVLAILRKKAEDAEERLRQADHQLGNLRGHLGLRGIPFSGVVDNYTTEYEAVESAYRPPDSDDEEEVEDEGDSGVGEEGENGTDNEGENGADNEGENGTDIGGIGSEA